MVTSIAATGACHNMANQITISYTNWRGEHTVRNITPSHLWFGITQWHPEPQWLIRAFDHDKQAERDFALSGFGQAPQKAPAEPVALDNAQIKHMVDRFLGWKLPEYFCPDAGVEFHPSEQQKAGVHQWPVGTNLFDADQATEMVRFMIEGLPAAAPAAEPAPPERQDALREARAEYDAAVKGWIDGGVNSDARLSRAGDALHAAPVPQEALPLDRDTLGRMVREAWVRWAMTQPSPKPSWLLPYDELAEPDKEADRQIGEAIAKWTVIHYEARAALAPVPATEAREGE